MHEATLAKQILEKVLEKAQTQGAKRILAIHGWIAEDEQLNPESLAMHFLGHAKGTPADGARLDFKLQWVSARCLACGQTYKPDHHVLVCPDCGSVEGKHLTPTGMGIETIDVE